MQASLNGNTTAHSRVGDSTHLYSSGHTSSSYKRTTSASSRTNHPGFTSSHTATTRPRWYHSISDNGRPNADGICQFFPIPENICTNIINLEYVDMAELKPTNWLLHSDETENASFPFKKRKEPVTDILVCYSAMASILAERYPAKIPHLMAYQSTIVKCAKRYQSLAWVAYDMEFRRKAAKTKSLDWGTIDQSAYIC